MPGEVSFWSQNTRKKLTLNRSTDAEHRKVCRARNEADAEDSEEGAAPEADLATETIIDPGIDENTDSATRADQSHDSANETARIAGGDELREIDIEICLAEGGL
jgi:hypothetical protein